MSVLLHFLFFFNFFFLVRWSTSISQTCVFVSCARAPRQFKPVWCVAPFPLHFQSDNFFSSPSKPLSEKLFFFLFRLSHVFPLKISFHRLSASHRHGNSTGHQRQWPRRDGVSSRDPQKQHHREVKHHLLQLLCLTSTHNQSK